MSLDLINRIQDKQAQASDLMRQLEEGARIRAAYSLGNSGKVTLRRTASATRDSVQVLLNGELKACDSLKGFETKTGVYVNWRVKR